MDPVLAFCIILLVMFLLIWFINPEHAQKINNVANENWNAHGKRIDKAVRWGFGIWRLLRRR